MSFTRILPADLNSRGATTLPNQPTISSTALKQEFDAPAKEVVAPKFNNLITELEATTAAADIGGVAPTGRTGSKLQTILNSISSDLGTAETAIASMAADEHTHANKALLDTYTQTEADLADAVSKKHAHSNKALLDTYTQTETDLADAVSKKHSHSNKALLDTYTQTETDLADAVSKKHAHSNKALLDTYTQTEANLSDAVSKKHTHANKTYIDKIGEDAGGNPTYNGNPIGGGGASDVFKNIVSAGTTFVASGDNDTFKINAGSNVTITALSSPDKGIQISAAGGGSSTGDMLMSDYDSSGDVKTAGGIKSFVSDEIGKLDVSDSAVSGQYVSAVSETDGKITVSRTSLPAIPTITDTYSGTSSDGMSGKAVKSAIDALDVSDSAVSGQYVSAVSETDGKISVTRASLPSIPTVNSSALTIQKGSSNSYFYANANGAATVGLDYYLTSVTQADGKATFDNLNPNYGYDLYYDDDGATGSVTVPTWAGTYTKTNGTDPGTIKLAYDINGGVNGTSKWTLRVLK